MGTVVQHVSSEGDLLFQWDPFDHFEITDLVPASRTGPSVNWMHGNSLDLDTDGNLIVSFRSLSEITKIDTRTGAVLWRMGGLKNQFVFQDAGAPDRKSTRLNSSHSQISYAVFCLKKKNAYVSYPTVSSRFRGIG